MKKNIAIVLAFLALAFVGCDENTPYEPGQPAETTQFIYFPVASELGLELDPAAGITSHDIKIARLDKTEAMDVTIKVNYASEGAFKFPETVHFNAGDSVATITVLFDKMEVGETYSFGIEAALSKEHNPYAALSSFYEFEATLIKYEPIVGVWEDATIGPAFGYAVTAWTVNAQVATLPSGNIKVRVINPYASLNTAPDGEFPNGFPHNDPGEVDTSRDYNFMLTYNKKDDEVRFADRITYLGISWGQYTDMLFYDYAEAQGVEGTYGRLDVAKNKIVFDAQDNTMLVGLAGSLYSIQVNFQFYFSLEAYEADQPTVEPTDADVTTYEGIWTVNGKDVDTNAEVVLPDVSIVSGEDEEGQYYTITGLHKDLPEVYGTFDEASHRFLLGYNEGDDVVFNDSTWIPAFYPMDAEGYLGNYKMSFEPAEDGSIVMTDDTEAIGFAVVYFFKENTKIYHFGTGIYDFSFEKQAAEKPAKAAKRPVKGAKALPRLMSTPLKAVR